MLKTVRETRALVEANRAEIAQANEALLALKAEGIEGGPAWDEAKARYRKATDRAHRLYSALTLVVVEAGGICTIDGTPFCTDPGDRGGRWDSPEIGDRFVFLAEDDVPAAEGRVGPD